MTNLKVAADFLMVGLACLFVLVLAAGIAGMVLAFYGAILGAIAAGAVWAFGAVLGVLQ